MERKKGITCLCIIVLVMMVVGYFLSRNYTPYLSPQMKAEIEQEYRKNNGDYYPFIWYDENRGKREDHVYRYFGKYGDCFVILAYGNNQDMSMKPLKLPWPLGGLSRAVLVPIECDILLYNANPNCKTYDTKYLKARLANLRDVKGSEMNWITDAQLEQLTDDLEAWVAKGNY